MHQYGIFVSAEFWILIPTVQNTIALGNVFLPFNSATIAALLYALLLWDHENEFLLDTC
jgi:hypothetical protein